MSRYECRICHGTCDPGELTGGVCYECAEEQQRQMRTSAVAKMINSQQYQMKLRLEGMKNAGVD